MDKPINLLKTFFRSPSIVRRDPLAARLWKPMRLLIFPLLAFQLSHILFFRFVIGVGVYTPAKRTAASITRYTVPVIWVILSFIGIVYYSRWAYKKLFLDNPDLAVTLINKRRWLEAFLAPAYCILVWVIIGWIIQAFYPLLYSWDWRTQWTALFEHLKYSLISSLNTIYYMVVFTLVSMRQLIKKHNDSSPGKFIWTPFLVYLSCYLAGISSFAVFRKIATLLLPINASRNSFISAREMAHHASVGFQLILATGAIIVLMKTSKRELLAAENALFESAE